MIETRTKVAVLALVVLLAFGATTVDDSLGVLSHGETLDLGDIVAGTETTSETGVRAAEMNETTGESFEKTAGRTTTQNVKTTTTTDSESG